MKKIESYQLWRDGLVRFEHNAWPFSACQVIMSAIFSVLRIKAITYCFFSNIIREGRDIFRKLCIRVNFFLNSVKRKVYFYGYFIMHCKDPRKGALHRRKHSSWGTPDSLSIQASIRKAP
jgi:hypothetical protein